MFGWLFISDRGTQPTFAEVRSATPPAHHLYAAFDSFDAMQVGAGPLLAFVKAEGEAIADRGWARSTHQRYLNAVDCRDMLLDFSRWCCVQAGEVWYAPGVVRQWLRTGDGTLAEAASLEAAAAVLRLPHAHPGRAIARTVVQIATPSFRAHQAAQAAAFNASYALACGCEGVAWTAARDAADDAQRVEFNRLLGVALQLDLERAS